MFALTAGQGGAKPFRACLRGISRRLRAGSGLISAPTRAQLFVECSIIVIDAIAGGSRLGIPPFFSYCCFLLHGLSAIIAIRCNGVACTGMVLLYILVLLSVL